MTQNFQVMVDLETMGTLPHAAILSIGAVKFDFMLADPVLDRFYCRVDLESCTRLGLVIEAKTVMWWMDVPQDTARKALFESAPIDLISALSGFATWYGELPVPTWSKGPDFDLKILETAFRVIGKEPPWHYRDQRCVRTVEALFPALRKPPIARIEHHALDDAEAQALLVCEAYKHIPVEAIVGRGELAGGRIVGEGIKPGVPRIFEEELHDGVVVKPISEP